MQTYVYRSGLKEFRFGYATAVGLFRSLIAFVLVMGANRLSKRLSSEAGV
jgi:putative aldouronate transport system permease protein